MEEVQELERTLREQRLLLLDHLHPREPQHAHHYRAVAVSLRLLLCDSNNPVLLTYAKHKGVALTLFGPAQIPPRLRAALAQDVCMIAASDQPFPGCDRYTLAEFLEIPVGVVPAGDFSSPSPGKAYSPRTLIKWIADKTGGAHLDFKKPNGLKMVLQTTAEVPGFGIIEEALPRMLISQLGLWTVKAIEDMLKASPAAGHH